MDVLLIVYVGTKHDIRSEIAWQFAGKQSK